MAKSPSKTSDDKRLDTPLRGTAEVDRSDPGMRDRQLSEEEIAAAEEHQAKVEGGADAAATGLKKDQPDPKILPDRTANLLRLATSTAGVGKSLLDVDTLNDALRRNLVSDLGGDETRVRITEEGRQYLQAANMGTPHAV